MSFLCNECWARVIPNMFDDELKCEPCNNLNVILIDDMVSLPVRMLNLNGIVTMFSCSGHFDVGDEAVSPYVMVSLTDTLAINAEDTGDVDSNGVITYIGDEREAMVDRLSRGNNFREIFDYWNLSGMIDDMSYNEYQGLIRIILRKDNLYNFTSYESVEEQVKVYEYCLKANINFTALIADTPTLKFF